jgi:hypothetical protein
MPQKQLIGKVLLQVLGAGAYFALVAILYWQRLPDAGEVAIILGLLFLFKMVVQSGAISISHLSPLGFGVRHPATIGRAFQSAQFLRRRDGGLD